MHDAANYLNQRNEPQWLREEKKAVSLSEHNPVYINNSMP